MERFRGAASCFHKFWGSLHSESAAPQLVGVAFFGAFSLVSCGTHSRSARHNVAEWLAVQASRRAERMGANMAVITSSDSSFWPLRIRDKSNLDARFVRLDVYDGSQQRCVACLVRLDSVMMFE